MAQSNVFKEFVPEEEPISAYLERIELFFLAHGVAAEKQVPTLLSTIGSKPYGFLRSLAAPKAPKELKYEEVVTMLKNHYEPPPLVIAERYRFHLRSQEVGETISEYVAELRRLATKCKFEDTTDFLEESLRDRFVIGLRVESTRKRLLTEQKLTLLKAIEIAQSLETATKDAQQQSEASIHTTPAGKEVCYRCGQSGHRADNCMFKNSVCHCCSRKGHIRKVCKSSRQQYRTHKSYPQKKDEHYVDLDQEEEHWIDVEQTEEEVDNDLSIFTVGRTSTTPISVKLSIDAQPLVMELDTGAAVSIVSEEQLRKRLPNKKVRPCAIVLRTYTAEKIPLLGEAQLSVEYKGQKHTLTAYITRGAGPCLLGRDWLRKMQLDWKGIVGVPVHSISSAQAELDTLLKRYQEVFVDGLGTMASVYAALKLKKEASPKFFRPRPIPFALREPVEQELSRLEQEGVLKKVMHSKWAAPIVPVPKRDGKVRICGDYKVTINQAIDVDQYPLPRPTDLFATMAKGKSFSKLDLSQAYQQMQLDEQSAQYLTINTHLGMYQYTRLPFGVASAPAIFQRAMDEILQGIEGTVCYIDDILVTGSTDKEHLQRLEEVLRRLRDNGLRLKPEKCAFFQPSVEYLGHMIDPVGIHPLPSKLEAIVKAPPPKNVQQLRSFLGLLNYYSKFVRNLASLIHPLNQLLQHNVRWKWSAECIYAFESAKKELVSSQLLAHYDPDLPIKMAADASAYGVGAVISHVFPNGHEKPVAFASRTLSKSEQNYAQLEKEALALIFGVKQFHQYLYGRRFTLVTDHRPLTTILHPQKGIPSLAAAKLQRWAIILSAYQYDILFKPTQQHGNADCLSRLPLPSNTAMEAFGVDVFNVAQVDSLPVTAEQIGQATRRDPLLSKVLRFTQSGWPQKVPEHLKPFWNRRDELTIECNCVMWGIRVIIPKKYQDQVLHELHQEHQGVARMKAVARSHVWWPKLDQCLEQVAKNCLPCQQVKNIPLAAPLHPWVWPSKPWQRIHIDFAGPMKGKMYLILVDAHSKWPEVAEISSTSAASTLQQLRSWFARFGLPEQCVSDNGPPFNSQDFAVFMKGNGIKHIRSSPYQPATNGLAERFVQTFKRALVTSEGSGKPVHHRLASFLLSYRNTPHATTNRSPSELFLKRSLRTRMDLLQPDSAAKVGEKQAMQKQHHDGRASQRERCYQAGDAVMARNYRYGPKWLPGTVAEVKGPLSYIIQLNSGLLWRRHINQLRDGIQKQNPIEASASTHAPPDDTAHTTPADTAHTPPANTAHTPPDDTVVAAIPSDSPGEPVVVSQPASNATEDLNPLDTTETRRYPQRTHRAPDKYIEHY